jgi:hypothetical protein
MEKSKVNILFKSGSQITLEVDKFTTTRSGNDLTKLSWENAKPNILYISLSDIEAIFEVE